MSGDVLSSRFSRAPASTHSQPNLFSFQRPTGLGYWALWRNLIQAGRPYAALLPDSFPTAVIEAKKCTLCQPSGATCRFCVC